MNTVYIAEHKQVFYVTTLYTSDKFLYGYNQNNMNFARHEEAYPWNL